MPRLCSQAMTEACLDRSRQPGKTFCPLCTATSTNSTGICDFGPNNSFHPEPRCGASWAEVSKLRSDRQPWASFTGLPSRDCSQMRDPCTPKLGGKVPVWLRRKGSLGQERKKERKKEEEEGALLGVTCAWPRVGGEYDILSVWCPSTTGRIVTLPILPPYSPNSSKTTNA